MKTRSSRTEGAEQSATPVNYRTRRTLSELIQRRLSGLLLALIALCVAGYGVLVLFVPRAVALWKETGADLTPTQRCLVQCSQFATENGVLIGVPLLLCFMVLFALRLFRLFG